MHSPEIISLQMTEAEALEEFLPTLLGRVFHFTKEDCWHRIAESGFVDTNQSGKLQPNSVHSHESLGRRLGAVCLFDLRGQDESIFSRDRILYDYLSRRWKKSPSCFLVVKPSHHTSLTTLADIAPDVREKTMYIPNIESWHPGNFPIDKLEQIYRLEII